jgi:hypothetical protein
MHRKFQATNARPFIPQGAQVAAYQTTGYIPSIMLG